MGSCPKIAFCISVVVLSLLFLLNSREGHMVKWRHWGGGGRRGDTCTCSWVGADWMTGRRYMWLTWQCLKGSFGLDGDALMFALWYWLGNIVVWNHGEGVNLMWVDGDYTMLKPKRHSLRCHGFVVHALLLRMNNNVVDFRVMQRLCHREWNWQCVNQHSWDP